MKSDEKMYMKPYKTASQLSVFSNVYTEKLMCSFRNMPFFRTKKVLLKFFESETVRNPFHDINIHSDN